MYKLTVRTDIFKCIKVIFLITLLALIPIFSFSQKLKPVKVTAEGEWDIVGATSPSEAEERALFEAKKEALRKAGAMTEIKSLSFISIINDSDKYYDEDFKQLSSVFIGGLVKVVKKETLPLIPRGTYFSVKVRIEAEVINNTGSDPEFLIEVTDLKTSYKHGEEFTFTVKPHKECYLRMFWFDNTSEGKGAILYPLDPFNNDIKLSEKLQYNFPLNSEIERNKAPIVYRIKKTTSKPIERNIILIVGTKKRIPYIGEVDYPAFFKWYYNIDKSDRSEINGFLINIVY